MDPQHFDNVMTSFCHQWEDRNIKKGRQFVKTIMEGFRLLGLYLYKFIGTNEAVYITKEFNSNRIGLEHQHGRRFIVFEHQYGRPDVMWKRPIFMLSPLFIDYVANFSRGALLKCPGKVILHFTFESRAVCIPKSSHWNHFLWPLFIWMFLLFSKLVREKLI